MKIKEKKISVVGLGKLGLPFVACLAEAGFKVIGIDINEKNINLLNKGISPISCINRDFSFILPISKQKSIKILSFKVHFCGLLCGLMKK